MISDQMYTITICTIESSNDKELNDIADMVKQVSAKRYRDRNKGFIVFAKDADWYAEKVTKGQIVATFKRENESIGFICGFLSSQMPQFADDSKPYAKAHEFTKNWAAEHRIANYFFLDQFVVLPKLQDQGIGTACYNALTKFIGIDIFIDVIEGPISNPRLRWWLNRGFKRIGTVKEEVEEEFGKYLTLHPDETLTHITWGLYHYQSK